MNQVKWGRPSYRTQNGESEYILGIMIPSVFNHIWLFTKNEKIFFKIIY